MAKQDESLRQRRRLQDYAMEMANTNQWQEALEANRRILELGEDPLAYNRLGKAYMELGMLQEAHDAYQQTMRLNPTNTIARRNVARLDSLLNRGYQQPVSHEESTRQQIDLRFFTTEAGKTIITSLVDVPRSPSVEAVAAGERVNLNIEDQRVLLTDTYDNFIGRLEPRLAQRLAELIRGGNRYVAAIVQSDPHQIRVLIREIYQDPSQRDRVSFPNRLIGDSSDQYFASTRYDYDTEDLLDDEEVVDEPEVIDTDLENSDDTGEIGLDQIEKDINDDDDSSEE